MIRTVRDYANFQMNQLLTTLVLRIHSAVKSPGPDQIHDVRVAIRRFAQGLILFSELFPKNQTKKIKRRLKRLMRLSSEIRNRDIAVQLLARSHAELRRSLIHERRGYERELLDLTLRWTKRDFSDRWRKGLEL